MTDAAATQLIEIPAHSRRARPVPKPTGPPRPVVLGILNVTPDSFSDGGRHLDVESAVGFASYLMESGADIVDVGGESTRPGADRLPMGEEQRRVLPVIRELRDRGIPVSIDTMNASTAALAAELGAAVINDVSGGMADPGMAGVAADTGLMFVAMHSRGPSSTMNERAAYSDTVRDVRDELEYRVARLIVQGVDPDRIVIDPGIGFAKEAAQNWELLRGLGELRSLGHPILLGASRKRFLADLLPEGSAPRRRDPATAVISALAADAGVWGVRVHDVVATAAAIDVWAAINGAELSRAHTSQRGATQHSAVQHSAVQPGAVQPSPVEHSAVQHSAGQHAGSAPHAPIVSGADMRRQR